MESLNPSVTITVENSEENSDNYNPLIPGLPDDISELCLLHLPYPYQGLARSVSSSWNKTITNPNFLLSKKTLSLSLPNIFVFAYHRSTIKLQWQAFDPQSGRWFVLPPMPISKAVCPSGFACVPVPRQEALYVLGGTWSDTDTDTDNVTPLQSVFTYRTVTNQWSLASPMLTPRSFFVAGCIDGKIIAAGGEEVGLGDTSSTVECYDTEKDTWKQVAKMRYGLARYDSAVVGKKMYVTEGWTWPFSFLPRGGIYDVENDTWEEMSVAIRDGWTGISVVLLDRLFLISEPGDCMLKVYVPDLDMWQNVGGRKFPCEAVQRPFAVSGAEGRIYVVACGLDMVVGRVFCKEERFWMVEWEVVMAPMAFHDLVPCNAQVLYT